MLDTIKEARYAKVIARMLAGENMKAACENEEVPYSTFRRVIANQPQELDAVLQVYRQTATADYTAVLEKQTEVVRTILLRDPGAMSLDELIKYYGLIEKITGLLRAQTGILGAPTNNETEAFAKKFLDAITKISPLQPTTVEARVYDVEPVEIEKEASQ